MLDRGLAAEICLRISDELGPAASAAKMILMTIVLDMMGWFGGVDHHSAHRIYNSRVRLMRMGVRIVHCLGPFDRSCGFATMTRSSTLLRKAIRPIAHRKKLAQPGNAGCSGRDKRERPLHQLAQSSGAAAKCGAGRWSPSPR